MKKIFFAFIFLLVLFVFVDLVNSEEVNKDEVNEYSKLKLQVQLRSDIELENNADIKSLEARVSFYPKDGGFQRITSREIKAVPDGAVSEEDDEQGGEEDELVYRWDKISSDKVSIENKFILNNEINFPRIKGKVKFPFEIVDEKEYLKSTQLIKADDKRIYQLAREIAEGKDDEYEVAIAIAEWIRENINYSLDTLTEKATKDSVWVLDNKYGVCDEITVLYIAMMRSLGIPAKFVSGSSYSNIIDGFGNHAWAEVYFPGYGWVAFDVTYGQLGWVDAGHIKMDESYDAEKSSITYSWKTRNGDVKPGEMKIAVDILDKQGSLDYDVGVNMEILDNKVRGGSYVPVQVELENKEDFYLPISVYLIKGPKIVEDNVRDVLLKPGERKRVFFLIEVPGELNKNSLYTSDIEVKTSFNDYDKKILEYADIYDFKLSRDEATAKIKELGEESEVGLSSVDVTCFAGKNVYYRYEMQGNLTCGVKNRGEERLSGDICLFEDCKAIVLNSGENKDYWFVFNISKVKNEIKVKVIGEGVLKYGYVNVKILERPGIKLDNLKYRGLIRYDEEGILNFTISSRDEVENLKIYIAGQEVFNIESFVNVNEFSFPFKGNYFLDRKAAMKITYEDRNNAVYELEEELFIQLEDVPWYARILEWIRNLRRDD